MCVGGAPSDGAQSGGETETDEAEDAGESTRLKLQTPVFVADALIEAAERQLDLEKTYCEDEVRDCCSILSTCSLRHEYSLSVRASGIVVVTLAGHITPFDSPVLYIPV